MKNIVKRFHFGRQLETFPKFRLGSFLIAVFCAFLIVIATFTPIPLVILAIPGEAFSNTAEFFANLSSLDQITRVLNYIPQIPVVIFIASMLGAKIGLFSIILYISCGLAGFPVFASGGGLSYISRLGFGYILGFLTGTFITGKLLSIDINRKSLIKAAILGVIAVHLTGIIYLSVLLLFQQESIFVIFGWIWQLSGIQIIYDLILSIVAIFLGRFARKALWLALD